MLTTVTKLSDKAMLVKLTIKRAALTKRDNVLTAKVQTQEGDTSITVLTKLFRDKSSPINSIMSAVNEAYTYHRTSTLPYVDGGPRILPNDLYMEYAQTMRNHISKVENLLATYMPYYDQLVLDDIRYRNAGSAAGRATADDYPTADKFRQSMQLEFRFQPMPDARHFLFDLSDDDLDAFKRAEEEAIVAANTDVVQRMLKPLSALVDRLKEYQGNKGERFHTSLISNVIEGCDIAKKLAMNATPQLNEQIEDLRSAAKACLDDVEIIKGSSLARDRAKAKLEAVASKMAAFA